MARRVFFSFHYQDVGDFRANTVRQHWRFKLNHEDAGFFDASIWESAKRTSPSALKRLINSALEGTTVTCVLVGSETYLRPWVRYEILKSFRRGNGLLAIHINSITGKDQCVKARGPNPLAYVGVTFSEGGDTATLWELVNGQWLRYSEIDDSATYRTGGVDTAYWGQGYNLSNWYPEYDWVSDKGWDYFAGWVEDAAVRAGR